MRVCLLASAFFYYPPFEQARMLYAGLSLTPVPVRQCQLRQHEQEDFMPRNKKYHPDYSRLYPDAEISPEVMVTLKKSDRKMEYMEWELKHSRVRKNTAGEITSVMSAREESLERMQEAGKFPGTVPSPEEPFFQAEEERELYRCLALLNDDEQALIHALFVDRLTEQEYAAVIGRTQQSVNERKQRILGKLKKLLKI